MFSRTNKILFPKIIIKNFANFIFASLLNGRMGHTNNPNALRKAKIVYNFDLSECNRVKDRISYHSRSKLFPFRVDPFF